MESREDIESAAAAWIHKRDCAEWTASDRAALEEWLKPAAHCTVFLRLDSVWREAARLKALGAGYIEQSPAAVRVSQHPASKWALAAGVVLAIALPSAGYLSRDTSSYRTDVGGVEGVSMVDGSHVTLNTDSEIRIAVTETERRVELKQGEAFFEVAQDAKRPFVVVSGHQRIVAVGTKFSVRRQGDQAQIVVSEGRVRVESKSAGGVPLPPTELTAGSIARSGEQSVLVQAKSPGEVDQYLSWRSGFLNFLGMPLSEAVAEFNRYNEQQIVIEDARVANLRIDGNFRSTNVNAFVRLLESGFPVQIERRSNRIVVRERQ